MQPIVATPFSMKRSAAAMKPGRCFTEQVGVNAPGRPKMATRLPPNNSSEEISTGPSSVMWCSVVDGTRSPTLMVTVTPPISLLAVHAPGMQTPRAFTLVCYSADATALPARLNAAMTAFSVNSSGSSRPRGSAGPYTTSNGMP